MPGDSTMPEDTQRSEETTAPDDTSMSGDTAMPEDTTAPPVEPTPPALPDGSWHAAGESGDSLIPSDVPVNDWPGLAYDAEGRAVVVFAERPIPVNDACPEDSTHLYVTRQTASGWTHLDGATPGTEMASLDLIGATGTQYAFAPQVAVDADGGVIVAWTASHSCQPMKIGSGLGTTIKVRRYDPATGWADLGDGSTSDFGISGSIANRASRLAIDPMGRPVVLYVTANANLTDTAFVHLRRFENGQWKGLGDSGEGFGFGDGVFTDFRPTVFSLAFTPEGEPAASWSRYPVLEFFSGGESAVIVKHWDGESWSGTAGSQTSPGLVPSGSFDFYEVALLVTPYGRMHAAFAPIWLGDSAAALPLHHVSALPDGDWAPKVTVGSAGAFSGLHLSRPVLASGMGDRVFLAASMHSPTAATKNPDDGVLVATLQEGEWVPVGESLEVVLPTGTGVEQVALQGSEGSGAVSARVGLLWVEQPQGNASDSGGLRYLQYP